MWLTLISVILTIVEHLPEILSVIKAIIDAIHGKSFGRIEALTEFQKLATSWAERVQADPHGVKAEIMGHAKVVGAKLPPQ